MPTAGRKNCRGNPELYSELKRCFAVALTPTGARQLDQLARQFELSRSEFVERIARGQIGLQASVPDDEPCPPRQDRARSP